MITCFFDTVADPETSNPSNSYFFIATFIAEHIAFDAKCLAA